MPVLEEGEYYDVLGPRFGKNWKMAAAIVKAESGGDTDALNVNSDGTRDRGPFQINAKWHPEVSDKCAFDFVCSATAASRISKRGTDWSQWSTFKNGAYKAHLDTALPDADDAGPFGVGRGKAWDSPGDVLSGVSGLLKGILESIFMGRFGKILLGALILLISGALVLKGVMPETPITKALG